jgi:sugar phosphate isomerase/epimerase
MQTGYSFGQFGRRSASGLGSPPAKEQASAMETSRLSVPAVSLSRDLRRSLRLARDLGVHAIELDGRNGLDPAQVTETGLRQIRKWLGDEGLVISGISFQTRGGYGDPDRLEGRIAATKVALKLAYDLGAGLVFNHIGEIPASAETAEWQLLVDVLTDIGTWSQHVGGRLCAEAGRAAPADLTRLFAALPEGSLACDIVTGSLVVHGHDPADAVATLGDHVAAVHATDAVAGPFAGRGRAVILGTGQVDFPAVFAALEERAYQGWIGLDPVEPREAREELAGAIEFLRAL